MILLTRVGESDILEHNMCLNLEQHYRFTACIIMNKGNFIYFYCRHSFKRGCEVSSYNLSLDFFLKQTLMTATFFLQLKTQQCQRSLLHFHHLTIFKSMIMIVRHAL